MWDSKRGKANMKKAIYLGIISLGLSGCSSISYIVDNYGGVQPVGVPMPDDRYRVFEHRTENRLMVTTSIGRAATDGQVRGLTLGIVNVQAPKPLFQSSAERYLLDTGRKHCKITDGYELVLTQYEFKFACFTIGRDKKEASSPHQKEPFTPYNEPETKMLSTL
jgi:hypothetical protein